VTEFKIGKRSRNLYDPLSDKPYKLSRSKLEMYLSCPRCFYIDRRLGVGRPSTPGYTLNMAVDELLKREFDQYRQWRRPHPIMEKHGIDAIPFQHDLIDQWRQNFTGVQYLDPDRNLLLFGAVDDLWLRSDGQILVVDYKATSTSSEITLDSEYRQAYKRQMEIYQWLLRKNGLPVASTGYFVYANALKNGDAFDGRLQFDILLLNYEGNDSWVNDTVDRAHRCLTGNTLPPSNPDCEYCAFLFHNKDNGW